ncbi:MAG: T9SS type A sorting domain-containing protein [Ignavibacteria bacterium]|jgi:photosystem II stability/assembly factor-like uncharacterized protein
MQKGKNMNKFKLFSIIFLVFFASYSFAQWSFVGGVTGAGTNPSISVVDPSLVFIGGGPSGVPAIFKSTNGGQAFTTVGVSGITLELYCIWAVDANTIYVGDGGASGGAGGNAKIWKTTDGGTSWTNILTTGGTAGFINGIIFSRTQTNFGIMESDPPTGGSGAYWIQKTNNNGANWILQSPPSVGSSWSSGQNSLFIIDSLFYGFGAAYMSSTTNNPKSVITSNGGATWYNAPLTGAPYASNIAFPSTVAFNTDKLNGIGGSSNTSTTCARTTNGGVSWFSQAIPCTITASSMQAKFVPNTNTVYIVVSSSTAAQSFKSTNNGATWTSLTWPSGVFNCTHIELIVSGNSVYVYAACGDGSVCKLVEPLTGVNDPQSTIPVDYKLQQNYPNPFNPTTTINYSIPKASFVTLKVYDILGNEVMAVVNEQQSAKDYSYNVDFSKLSSGVYYYTLNAGNYTSTKRLTLIK